MLVLQIFLGKGSKGSKSRQERVLSSAALTVCVCVSDDHRDLLGPGFPPPPTQALSPLLACGSGIQCFLLCALVPTDVTLVEALLHFPVVFVFF